jgi:O-antigen/teichoic acid export membrane protein
MSTMHTLKRALSNSAILMVSQVITWTATLILTAALGRYLGAVGFGELYLAISFGVIFSGIVQFGLDQQLVRAVTRDRSLAGTYLVHSLTIKLLLVGFAYAAIIGIIYALQYPPEVKLTIAVYCIVLLFNALTESLTAVYQAFESLLYSALGTILEKVFIAALAIFLLTRGYGVVTMAGASWLAARWERSGEHFSSGS